MKRFTHLKFSKTCIIIFLIFGCSTAYALSPFAKLIGPKTVSPNQEVIYSLRFAEAQKWECQGCEFISGHGDIKTGEPLSNTVTVRWLKNAQHPQLISVKTKKGFWISLSVKTHEKTLNK